MANSPLDGNDALQPSFLRGLLGNSDQHLSTVGGSKSLYSHDKWFVIYGFTVAHSDSEHIDEESGVTCSDSIKATYAKGIKANTCLQTIHPGTFIKVSCSKKRATLTHYLDSTCNEVNPKTTVLDQSLGCQPAVADRFASRSGTWLDDFDGESFTLRSLLFACTKSFSDEERLPLPMTYYTTSSYYAESTCSGNNLIGFHAIRNRVCLTTGTSSSTKYAFPEHTRFSPSRSCTGEGFKASSQFISNCTRFVANEALANNGNRIGQVSFPFVSSALVSGKTSIKTIMSTSTDEVTGNFILISVLVAVLFISITVCCCCLQRRFRSESHSMEVDSRIDTSLDISIRGAADEG